MMILKNATGNNDLKVFGWLKAVNVFYLFIIKKE
jgi:hypothetical protein